MQEIVTHSTEQKMLICPHWACEANR